MTIERTFPSSPLRAAMPHISRRHAVAALAAASSLPALAQFRVEIAGVGATKLARYGADVLAIVAAHQS